MEGELPELLQISDQALGIKTLRGLQLGRAVHFADNHAMRGGKSLWELLLKDGASCRV